MSEQGYDATATANAGSLGDMLMMLAVSLNPKMAPAANLMIGLRAQRQAAAEKARKTQSFSALQNVFEPRDVLGETGREPSETVEDIEVPETYPETTPTPTGEKKWEEEQGFQEQLNMLRGEKWGIHGKQPPEPLSPEPSVPLYPPIPRPPTKTKKYTIGSKPVMGKIGEEPSEPLDWIRRVQTQGGPEALEHIFPTLATMAGVFQKGERTTDAEMAKAFQDAGISMSDVVNNPLSLFKAADALQKAGRSRDAMGMLRLGMQLMKDREGGGQAFVTQLTQDITEDYEALPPNEKREASVMYNTVKSLAGASLQNPKLLDNFFNAARAYSDRTGAFRKEGRGTTRAMEYLNMARQRITMAEAAASRAIDANNIDDLNGQVGRMTQIIAEDAQELRNYAPGSDQARLLGWEKDAHEAIRSRYQQALNQLLIKRGAFPRGPATPPPSGIQGAP